MSEWSEYHRGIKPQDRLFAMGPAETIRKEVPYQGFLLQRTDPNHGYMWAIYNTDGKGVAGLGGSFTKLEIAKDAIDRHLQQQEKEKREFGEITAQSN
jgi:hypothetical protein